MLECEDLESSKYILLVKRVGRDQFLYDNNHKDFYNQIMVRSKWQEISLEIGMPVIWCRTRWEYLMHVYKHRNSKSNMYKHLFRGVREACDAIDFITHFGNNVLISKFSPESSTGGAAECNKSCGMSDDDEYEFVEDPSESYITAVIPPYAKCVIK